MSESLLHRRMMMQKVQTINDFLYFINYLIGGNISKYMFFKKITIRGIRLLQDDMCFHNIPNRASGTGSRMYITTNGTLKIVQDTTEEALLAEFPDIDTSEVVIEATSLPSSRYRLPTEYKYNDRYGNMTTISTEELIYGYGLHGFGAYFESVSNNNPENISMPASFDSCEIELWSSYGWGGWNPSYAFLKVADIIINSTEQKFISYNSDGTVRDEIVMDKYIV